MATWRTFHQSTVCRLVRACTHCQLPNADIRRVAHMAASSQVCKAAVWTAFGSLALCWLCSQKLGMTSLVTASPQPRRFSEHANWLLPGHLMIGRPPSQANACLPFRWLRWKIDSPGRYPYLNPVYCMSQQDADKGIAWFVGCLRSRQVRVVKDADAQLRSLLDAGVTTFVCLQTAGGIGAQERLKFSG